MENKQVLLVTHDGQKIQVQQHAIEMSRLIKEMLIDDSDEMPEIPLSYVEFNLLQRIVQFVEYHVDNLPKEIHKPIREGDFTKIVDEWDAKFMDIPVSDILEMSKASNYMDIPHLLDMCLAKLASLMYLKSPEQVMEMFGIKTKPTPEEERKLREDNKWIFQVPSI
jgi:S-phase kinase-associated protein 1